MQKFLPKPGEEPSDNDAINNGYYDIELFGQHPTDGSKNVRVRVKGDKIDCGSTSKMIVEALALTGTTAGGRRLLDARLSHG